MKNVNVRESIAKREIREAFSWIVGGEENTLLDYGENTKEYREAKAFLSDRTAIMKKIALQVLGLAVMACPLLVEKRYPVYHNGRWSKMWCYDTTGFNKYLH